MKLAMKDVVVFEKESVVRGQFPTAKGRLFYGGVYLSTPSMLATFEELKDKEVQHIWNLLEHPFYMDDEKKEFNVIHTPIRDYDTPEPNDFLKDLNLICELLSEEHSIYVHCMAGHGRTGMALAAIDIVLNKANSLIALGNAFNYCKGPENQKQKEFVKTLEILYR